MTCKQLAVIGSLILLFERLKFFWTSWGNTMNMQWHSERRPRAIPNDLLTLDVQGYKLYVINAWG